MSNILVINLSEETFKVEPLPEKYVEFGGRGLTSAIISDEVPATADPLGAENVLVFAPGLLAGTTCPNSGRLSVGAKSPLTGTIKEANSGGSSAQKIARLGLAAIVLKGKATTPKLLRVDEKGVHFLPAGDLWGLGTYSTFEKIAEDNPGCGLISIGPAGEKGLKSAAVCVTSPDGFIRTAARGGLGSVMGSKNVKAIVLDDTGGAGATVADPEAFRGAVKGLSAGIIASPLTQGFQALGTAMLVNVINGLGALPTRNYSAGEFENAEKISGEALAGIMGSRKGASTKHRCMNGCIINCSQVYTDEDGKVITSGVEYETLVLVGSNCEIDDPDAVAKIDRACDDIGIDTMETGAALAVAMEAGKIPWGDGSRVLEVLESIMDDNPLGLLIGNGCVAVGKELGVERVPAVKGQSMAAYDPRVLKATGVTYATTPMGADHTCGVVLPDAGNPEYDFMSGKGQGPVSEGAQAYFAAIDTLGLCLFASLPLPSDPALIGHLIAAVSAKTGKELPESYLGDLGEKVCRMEREFNRAAGFGPEDDRLPKFFSKEALPPHNITWDVSDEDLDNVFA